MTRVAILGAGIAGLCTGWILKRAGIDFIVFEQQSYPGGLARSFQWQGFNCDFAAHRLFSANEEVLQQLLSLVPMGRHVRRSRIYLQGHWMRDPLDVLELAANIPLVSQLKLIFSFWLRPKNVSEDSFENFVLKRYGDALYRTFFKPYTEKLFGIPGVDISVLWARQKVRLANPLDKITENSKTKFSYFYYPIHQGYGAIANKLYEEIKDQVNLNARVLAITHEEGKLTSLSYQAGSSAEEIPVDYVVSTLPMSITGKMLGHKLDLKYQKVDAVYLSINRPLVSDYHWVYFIDEDICVNRMVEFKNMSAVDTPSESTVLCAEVTQEHEDVAEKVVSDLVRIGLIQREEVLATKVVRENYAYPVYDRNYDLTLKEAEKIFKNFSNLLLVGRAAEFRHREVDDILASSMEAVNKIITLIPDWKPAPVMKSTTKEIENMVKVTAVVLTYNHYEDTKECIESLRNLLIDSINFDVILVDNGSTDGTVDQVRRDFPGVHIIENMQNLGVAAGYNVGFAYALQAGADYIFMLNNDVILAPNILIELLAVASADPQTGIVMPKMMYYGSNDVWSSGGRYRAFPPAILMTDRRKGVAELTRMIEFAPSCALLINSQAFDKVGLFDPGYFFLFDDWDFSERVRAHGFTIWYAANALLWHKVSRTTKGTNSGFYWRTFGASVVRYWRRHGRPIWFSLPLHVGYIFLREFFWHFHNVKYSGEFWRGVRDGLQKPLGVLPKSPVISYRK